jgi:hypothetical protein
MAATVVACLLLSASSCSLSRPFVSSGAPKIQFIGDSITEESVADIDAHFGASYDVAIEATGGTDTYMQAANVAAAALLSPAFAIINLGTNDALRMNAAWTSIINGQTVVIEPQQTLTDVTGRLDAFAAAFPATACVVFVTVNSHNPSWAPANTRAINDHIRATFPHVADWDAAVQPSYFAAPDNPVPNAAGRQALLAIEDQAMASCAASPPTFSNVVTWTHAWDTANSTTYTDDVGTVRVEMIPDTGNASTPLPAQRDQGFYGAALGMSALPGPVFNPADAQFGGRPSLDPDSTGMVNSMLSPNVDPTSSADWFDAPNGIAAPYWVAVLGNLGPDLTNAAAIDSQQGGVGSCPTIGGGLFNPAKWSIATFGPPPFPWPSINKPLVPNETYLMLAEVAPGTNASFLEIDWRDTLGALHQVHQAVTLTPYTCKEMFLGFVHSGHMSVAAIKTGAPSNADLTALRIWASPYLRPDL